MRCTRECFELGSAIAVRGVDLCDVKLPRYLFVVEDKKVVSLSVVCLKFLEVLGEMSLLFFCTSEEATTTGGITRYRAKFEGFLFIL